MNAQRQWLIPVMAMALAACQSAAAPKASQDAADTLTISVTDTTTATATDSETQTATATDSETQTATATDSETQTTTTTATDTSATTGTSSTTPTRTTTATATTTETGTATPTPTDAGTTSTDRSTIEFGRKLWGSDHATRAGVPAGGTLFSVWTKIPDPGSSYPWSRGNMDAYVLSGNNWYFRCLVGNSSARSPTNARYNANTMLFANPGETWIADYSYYESGEGHPEAPYRDWVWVAWQVLVGKDAFTIRQWLKLGIDGEVFAAGESSPTFAEARAILVENGWSQSAAAAWTPGEATSFQVGKDDGFLSHARMMARTTLPALTELDAIARRDAADPSAWADYRLAFANGKPDLSDRSGNGRDLTLANGGTLYEGPPGPAF
jgi:hypothetical protein